MRCLFLDKNCLCSKTDCIVCGYCKNTSCRCIEHINCPNEVDDNFPYSKINDILFLCKKCTNRPFCFKCLTEGRFNMKDERLGCITCDRQCRNCKRLHDSEICSQCCKHYICGSCQPGYYTVKTKQYIYKYCDHCLKQNPCLIPYNEDYYVCKSCTYDEICDVHKRIVRNGIGILKNGEEIYIPT